MGILGSIGLELHIVGFLGQRMCLLMLLAGLLWRLALVDLVVDADGNV